MWRGPLAERVARDHDLPDDFRRRQIAYQALRAGVAEGAGQRTADLRRDAQRAAVALRDVDGLDLLAVIEAQQPFPGPVGRGEGLADLGTPQLVDRGKLLAEAFRQARHRREIGGAAVVDPVPQLARAERLGAETVHFRRQLGAAQPDEVAALPARW